MNQSSEFEGMKRKSTQIVAAGKRKYPIESEKAMEEEDIEELEEYVIGKSGSTVWVGTKDAIKDSKG